ncbi:MULTISPECIES: hypothetical protein [Sphingomonas]|uniref:hypothetical protein n=1 Tax=Sphingomonas TaxID=13687 RepID=UPI001269EBA4|nr:MULTISPECIES: hypothetical protein [Sphingomonas]
MPLALLAFAAALQAGPAPAPVMHPPHVIAGGGATGGDMAALITSYRECLRAKAAAVPVSVTPEAAAATAMAGCQREHDAVSASMTEMIATLPAEQQTMIRAKIAEREAAIPGQIADGIRAARAGTPAPAK